MAESFDPYYRWLSIPAEEQPPDHYRLLGLKALESDLDVIESAADRQMTHVRTFQGGKYAEHSQRLLNEIAAAKVTLLDPTKKSAYDAPLRLKLNEALRRNTAQPLAVAQALPRESPLAAAPPTVPPPDVASASPVMHAPLGPSMSATFRQRRKGPSTAIAAALVGLVLLVVGALTAVAMIVRPWETKEPVAQNNSNNTGNPVTSPPVEPPPVIVPPPVVPPKEKDSPKTEDPDDDEPEVPDDGDEDGLPPEEMLEEESSEEYDDVEEPDEFVRPKAPIPAKSEREAKQASIESIFHTDKAKSPAEKAEMAANLFRTSRETPDDLVAQFVMLNMAREMAGDAARMQLAFDAIDLLEQQFEFDADAVRIVTINQGAKAAVPNEAKHEVVSLGVELADRLAMADRYADATKLLTTLVELARRARDAQVAAALVERRRANESLFAEFKSAQGVMETLKTSPDDPAANLAAGRFYLFVKNDAARGLSHLAKAGDHWLAAPARLELANPQSPDDQEKLADTWYTLAPKESNKDAQKKLQSRAFAWYRRAKPELKGLAAAKAEKRLQEMADAGVQPAEIDLDLGIFDDPRSSSTRAPRLPRNLLDLVDVSKHSVRGTWARSESEIIAPNQPGMLLKIPVIVQGDYSLKVEFTRIEGGDTIGIFLPVGERYCKLLLGSIGNKVGGIGIIDGHGVHKAENPTHIPLALTNGKRYQVNVSVRQNGDSASIVAELNGQPVVRWTGLAASLSDDPDHTFAVPEHLGLFAWDSRAVFHRVGLTMLSGEVTPDDDAVLPKRATVPTTRRMPANLLDLVDVDMHALKQKWTRDGDDVVAPQAYAPLLKIPVTVIGNYELTVEFTRQSGGDIVGVILPVGDLYCNVLFSTNGGEAGYIGDGGASKVTIKPSHLTNGKRHALTARVISKGDESTVDVTLDGAALARWTGIGSKNDAGDRRMPEPRHIGLYAHESQTAFHTAKLKLLAGAAKPDADARKLPRAIGGSSARDVTRGLVAHWKFDDGEGKVATDSVGGHDGTIKGATWIQGIRGGALRFDGQSAVTIGNPDALNFEGEITMTAWVRVAELPVPGGPKETQWRCVVSHGYHYKARREVAFSLFAVDGRNVWDAGVWDGDKSIHGRAEFAERDLKQWIHVAALYDGSHWRVYRNGRLLSSTPSTIAAVTVPSSWAIGAHGEGNVRPFHGDIDDVRIYNRGLSADEVQTLATSRTR